MSEGLFIYRQEIEWGDFNGEHPKDHALALIKKNGGSLVKAIPATTAGAVFFSTNVKLKDLPESYTELTGKLYTAWYNDLNGK